MVLLQRALLTGRVESLEVDWPELNRKMMDPVSAARSVAAQQMAVLSRELAAADSFGGRGGHGGGVLSGRSVLGMLRAAAGGVGGVVEGQWRRRGSGRSGGGAADAAALLDPSGSGAPPPAGPMFGGDGYDYAGHSVVIMGHGENGGGSAAAAAAPPPPPRGPGLQAPATARAAANGGGRGAGAASSSSSYPSGGAGGSLTFGDELPTSTPASASAAAGPSKDAYGVGGGGGDGGWSLENGVIDLTPYINTSVFMVPDSFSVERTYVLFRTMGLRHLIVVDEQHTVKGIVTRKDLLGYRLDDALARALNGPSVSGHPHTPSRPIRGPTGGTPFASAGGSAAAAAGLRGSAAGAGGAPATASTGGARGGGGGGGGAMLVGRPGVSGGMTSLHPTSAGMRNLLVSGEVLRPSAAGAPPAATASMTTAAPLDEQPSLADSDW
ncbi:hypothetical protein GPECTOR_35g952 [Gonium pectorale]|uniref:CBS domain-containing protein n=1 Tax=Gonium pectorale TaxID=33097 RepID=A0A150GCE5_GONPE|nr:hypothetical protein GPECTOR_35g952 [Gonium pectorale]|eukprot:KXZ47514.1 hypothetical protein GPECTOR_35g952 [Gonium pectorale]